MHTIFETDCFVISSSPQGEANKQLDLLTRDFGLIRATAQGVRWLKSKLRYSLTDFSLTHVSLVRGKEFWRVTTATKIADVSADITSKEARETLFRIFALLRRLLQGEEAHVELFDTVRKMFEVLRDISTTKPSDILPRISVVEELTVLRILFLLGYVKDDPALRSFVETFELDEGILKQSSDARKTVVAEINRALKASNL